MSFCLWSMLELWSGSAIYPWFTVLISAPKSIQLVLERLAKPRRLMNKDHLPGVVGIKHKSLTLALAPHKASLIELVELPADVDWENPLTPSVSGHHWVPTAVGKSAANVRFRQQPEKGADSAIFGCWGGWRQSLIDFTQLWLIKHRSAPLSTGWGRELSVLARAFGISSFQLAAGLPKVAPARLCLVAAIFGACNVFCPCRVMGGYTYGLIKSSGFFQGFSPGSAKLNPARWIYRLMLMSVQNKPTQARPQTKL